MSDDRTVLPCPDLASWRGERVLVTEGRGFLGSHLCRRLAEVGADVHATSRQRRISEQGTTRWWQSDLSSLEEVRSILAQVKPAVIYHWKNVSCALSDSYRSSDPIHGFWAVPRAKQVGAIGYSESSEAGSA